MIRLFNNNRGFTMVECILALALCAVLFASLTPVFSISLNSWRENNKKSELISHANIAMARLTSELKYAMEGVNLSDGTVEFDTVELVDNDSEIERIRYAVSGNIMTRSVDGGIASEIAGSVSENVFVTALSVAPLKLDGSNNLVDLDGGDEAKVAEAARISITVQDVDGDTFSLSSLVNFRNKG